MSDRSWSIYRLSKESKVSASTLHDFLVSEKIKFLGTEKLQKVATALGVPIECLFDDKTISTLKEEQYNFIPDKTIRMIARAGEHMTDEQKRELLNLAERLYGDAFEKL